MDKACVDCQSEDNGDEKEAIATNDTAHGRTLKAWRGQDVFVAAFSQDRLDVMTTLHERTS